MNAEMMIATYTVVQNTAWSYSDCFMIPFLIMVKLLLFFLGVVIPVFIFGGIVSGVGALVMRRFN